MPNSKNSDGQVRNTQPIILPKVGISGEVSREVCRIIDLGNIMKMVLMQEESFKLVEDILQIIRKTKNQFLNNKQQFDHILQFIKNVASSSLTEEKIQELKIQDKIKQKLPVGETNKEVMQKYKDKIIEKIVEELFNAKQDAKKLELTTSSNSISSDDSKNQDNNQQVYVKKQSDEVEVAELKRIINNLESQNKLQKKLLDDSTKALLQKQQKIQNLKGIISKLEQHIIRQVKIQGQNQIKFNASEASLLQVEQDRNNLRIRGSTLEPQNLIKSQALERQVVQLKKQIQILKYDLSKSVQAASQKESQLLKMSLRFGYNQQWEREKSKIYQELSQEYSILKGEISQFIQQQKYSQVGIDTASDSEQQQSLGNFCTLKAELNILSEKYGKLLKTYGQLKQQHDKFVVETQNSKKQSQVSIIQLNDQSEQRLAILKSSGKSRKTQKGSKPKNSEQKRVIDIGIYDDEQSIIRDIKDINKMQMSSQAMGISSFQSLINPTQMAAKIQGFDYNASIIHKVNASKFIQTFQAKLSFILQYVCLLELYFNRNFLSCIREELMMQDTLSIKALAFEDLNQTHFVESSQNNSFSSNSNSRLNSSKISNKFQPENKEQDKNILGNMVGAASTKSGKAITLQRLQDQLKQISGLITNDSLSAGELRSDPEFIARIKRLKENTIAQIITNLVKQNDVFKKCLNQMIKNEENFTKINNEIYFDSDGEIRRRSTSINMNNQQTTDKKVGKDKQNCHIM